MELLSGNEAIAQGAWEAGVRFGFAYPGTPSTETLECLGKHSDVYAEWCTNEKVALEAGIGASAAGARVLVCMKHVGVNVAADPLFTAAYTGVGGGLVILAADDPGMYSSQNEQDSHYYAQAARIPVLDPADSGEALLFTKDAFSISERFDVPVMIRSSVRISHTKNPVDVSKRNDQEIRPYSKDPSKWVMMPAYAKLRKSEQLKRIATLSDWVEDCPYNKLIEKSHEIGIVCFGATYQHVIEALPHASVFKLGITWPLPHAALHSFAESVDKLYVIEEATTFLYDSVSSHGISVSDPPYPLPGEGELSSGIIRTAFGLSSKNFIKAPDDLPGRPPALCPGCPHRVVFREISRLNAIVTGDIGCYTLGALPPLSAIDTCVDMGASISMSHGFNLALEGTDHRPVIAVIGDSTFAHSGLSSLISSVYNCGKGTVCILDNRTTAMTGRQGNPFNGVTLQGRKSRELDLEGVISSLGIDDVSVVDPFDVSAVRMALKGAVNSLDTLSVIIFRRPCVLLERHREPSYYVTDDCTGCGACITIGCPALSKDAITSFTVVDSSLCVGCGQCFHYCRFNALKQGEAFC